MMMRMVFPFLFISAVFSVSSPADTFRVDGRCGPFPLNCVCLPANPPICPEGQHVVSTTAFAQCSSRTAGEVCSFEVTCSEDE